MAWAYSRDWTIDDSRELDLTEEFDVTESAHLLFDYLWGLTALEYAAEGSFAVIEIDSVGAGEEADFGGSVAEIIIVSVGGGEHAGEDLYFIDEPQIKTQGVIATHVTVRSPTAEYTAEIPATPAENTIERLVEIKEGNADTCQAVAEGLLERWGRQQTSITGRVPLVVTLRFRQLVNIIIPVAEIDGTYILQRKEHDLSSFESRVTVGDIILSDDELLARILEEVE